MSYGLTDTELHRLLAVFSSNPRVEKAVLYGSRAKGTGRPFSDIDITLTGSLLSHDDLNQIAGDIDDLLLPYQCDLSLWRNLTNEALKDHIRRVGVVLYSRDGK